METTSANVDTTAPPAKRSYALKCDEVTYRLVHNHLKDMFAADEHMTIEALVKAIVLDFFRSTVG